MIKFRQTWKVPRYKIAKEMTDDGFRFMMHYRGSDLYVKYSHYSGFVQYYEVYERWTTPVSEFIHEFVFTVSYGEGETLTNAIKEYLKRVYDTH